MFHQLNNQTPSQRARSNTTTALTRINETLGTEFLVRWLAPTREEEQRFPTRFDADCFAATLDTPSCVIDEVPVL